MSLYIPSLWHDMYLFTPVCCDICMCVVYNVTELDHPVPKLLKVKVDLDAISVGE